MSHHTFDPKCPDCRPCLLDTKTGQTLPPDHPQMRAINKVWDESSYDDQLAFHRMTSLNSEDPDDHARMHAFLERVNVAMKTGIA